MAGLRAVSARRPSHTLYCAPAARRKYGSNASVVNSLWVLDCLVDGRLLPKGARRA